MKCAADLKAVLGQRTWDKEVILWLGGEKPLINTLGSSKRVVLDLLELFNPDSLPDEESTKEVLSLQLRQWLRSISKGPDNRTVLIVKSIGLLARYRVGLKEFYDWFVGSYTILVLLLDEVLEKSNWPDEVRCDPKLLLGYFEEPGMVKEMYAAN